MAKTIYLDKLLRLTLTRKGRAVAKHPYLREGVVEAVKATSVESQEPLWATAKSLSQIESGGQQVGGTTPGLARYTSGRYQ